MGLHLDTPKMDGNLCTSTTGKGGNWIGVMYEGSFMDQLVVTFKNREVSKQACLLCFK